MSKEYYKAVRCTRGREWIFRVSTGQDVFEAFQKFAMDNHVEFARIHTAFMGGFEPARMLVWAPDTTDPENWHHESPMEVQNLTMLLSMGGLIHIRKGDNGEREPFPAIHYIVGAAWNAPICGGHLVPGTIAKGNLECFITEILDIETYLDDDVNASAPETWYFNTKGES